MFTTYFLGRSQLCVPEYDHVLNVCKAKKFAKHQLQMKQIMKVKCNTSTQLGTEFEDAAGDSVLEMSS